MARAEKVANPKTAVVGAEPDATKIVAGIEGYNTKFITAMNWYSIDGNKADARKFIREYIKKSRPADLKDFDKVSDKEIRPTYGWIARVLMLGAKLSDYHVENFNEYLLTILKSVITPTVQKTVIVSNKLSIQDAMNEKISAYIGTLEGAYDDYITEGTEFSLEADMKSKEIPQAYVAKIDEWAKRKLREWIEITEGKDAQLNEAFSHYTKTSKKDVAKFFAAMIQDCEKYGAFKKANRKPRTVRQKTPAQQVKNLKYKTKDDELNISSVNPMDIVGASAVWLFNTKNRKLSVYRTDSGQGLQVKGSALQNYDPGVSEVKTLRKPAEQLMELLNAGKVQLRKFMEGIKTKGGEVNGRVNAEMLIVRVVR
ncbi:MAG: hypothetical protein EBU90_07370 [Proteobacteria bacterium]|nr:hypothetical protein [Pseudomonadota bacterium]NBP13477.1 hypothetical protein [bacterium]